MPTVVVFEEAGYRNLLPLVYWRACFELRLGYDTLLDKVRSAWPAAKIVLFVRDYLKDVVAERYGLPANEPVTEQAIFVNARLRVSDPLSLPVNTVIELDDQVAAAHLSPEIASRVTPEVCLQEGGLLQVLQGLQRVAFDAPPRTLLNWPWEFVHANEDELARQWNSQVGRGEVAGTVYDGAYLLNPDAIYIGPGSRIKPCSVLDAEDGPIYIGKNVTISPNVTIQGPCYIGDNTLIQPGAAIKEGTSIGPVCKVGGEVEATIIHSYSNKQHDGFLGHSYLGQWINIAAGCVNSDLKNTYGSVRVPINGVEVDAGEMFVGMTVGDHTKTGINSAFPTGAVVGFGSNVFVSSYPPKFVPSFSWMTDKGAEKYDPKRGIAVAKKVMARRKVEMSPAEERLYLSISDLAQRYEKAG